MTEGVVVEVNSEDLLKVIAALKTMKDGKYLKAAMVMAMRKPLRAIVLEEKEAALSIPTPAGRTAEPALLPAIASSIGSQTRMTARKQVAKVRSKTIDVRKFWQAPRKMNRAEGWDHPQWGHEPKVHQVGDAKWFDKIPPKHRAELVRELNATIEATMAVITKWSSKA